MNFSNNIIDREVDLSSVCQIRSRCVTPILKKRNFAKFTPISPKSINYQNCNVDKKNEKLDFQKKNELLLLKNNENIQKSLFFEENKEIFNFNKKEKNKLKSTFMISDIKTHHEIVESKNIDNNNSIITESKIFFNPLLRYNENSNNMIKFSDDIKKDDDLLYIKKSSFCLRKFNFFKVMKRTGTFLKEVKKIHNISKEKRVRKKRRRKFITCHCKTTECLKLYCECKKQNGFCNRTCKCLDCKNTKAYQII